MKKYVMAFDEGTTSARCVLYDREGNTVSTAQKEFKQIFPQNGWVEHDPMEIWSVQIGVAQEAMYKINCTFKDIAAIGITNQRETTVVWDKNTGVPIYNAIVWQCRRTAEYCDSLKNAGKTDMIKEKTGLLIDPYFSATKLRWILENVHGAREKAVKGELLFGTIETWLIWKLTSGRVHVTDYTNAARTMMFDIHSLKWDKEILELLNIPESMLPQPVPSSSVYGFTDAHIFGGEIPIAGAAGDQQSSLFGLNCFDEGDCKMTYGTGGFMLMNTGNRPVRSENGLLTTIAWGIEDKVNYALEGSVFVAGAAVHWLRDELGIIKNSAETEKMAMSVSDTNGAVFVPAFTGLGAPYWDPYARGAIFGLSRGTNKNHIARAVLESLGYQTKDLAEAMASDCGTSLKEIKIDGGAAANNFIAGFQADITGCDIVRPACIETTSLGAAYLAGLATGYWKNIDDIKENFAVDRVFHSNMSEDERNKCISKWNEAVKRTKGWIKSL